ncbi:MAG: methylmalonyl-CoA epimerase [Anaerolineae bacterium]|nr:methylmalonyl-CoA epimerase [Anaerolineae bacterium]
MITKVDHIGIAVRDIEEARRLYEALGLKVTHVKEVEEQQVRVAFLPVGDTEVELVQPTTADSGVARFLEKRGEGVHHLCFEVEDIEVALAELQAQGMRLIDREPRQGAFGRVAFLHPKSTHGVLIELVEKS